MHSLRDNHILLFISSLLIYISYRYHHIYDDNTLIGDIICLCVCSFIIWHFYFNNRTYYMMSISRLSDHYIENKLNYYFVSDSNGLLDRVYVNISNDDEWHELNYDLTLCRGCKLFDFERFASDNDTVGKLSKTMDNTKKFCGSSYSLMMIDHNSFKWLSFGCLLVVWFIVFMIMINKGIF